MDHNRRAFGGSSSAVRQFAGTLISFFPPFVLAGRPIVFRFFAFIPPHSSHRRLISSRNLPPRRGKDGMGVSSIEPSKFLRPSYHRMLFVLST